jgi:hypothetical protein
VQVMAMEDHYCRGWIFMCTHCFPATGRGPIGRRALQRTLL